MMHLLWRYSKPMTQQAMMSRISSSVNVLRLDRKDAADPYRQYSMMIYLEQKNAAIPSNSYRL